MSLGVLLGKEGPLPSAPLKQDRINASAATVLPDDLLTQVLSFLSPEDLARASGVCREWSNLSAEVWKDFDLNKICKVIDQAVWERHVDLATLGLDASGAPAIDKRVAIPFIKRLSRQVEGDAGVTLLTMPKGLTLNKLIALAAAPKQGPARQFRHIWPRIVHEFGNIAVDKTYTVAITNSVLKGSRNKNIAVQRALAQGNGGELPGVLLASTVAFLTYVSSPEGQPPTRLYGNEPWVHTRCSEQIGEYNLVVGGFAPAGPYAHYDYFDNAHNGAGVAKKL
jgi:hypothetical protein